jgi:hypothetical protein
MPTDPSSFSAQRRGWATLKRLHPTAIDLQRIALIRQADRDQLSQVAAVEALLLRLGLNDEGLDELPSELHGACGGLRIWQYPSQLGKYLVQLSRLHVRSYLEIGIRHGGSFVATTEYLDRFHPLDVAVGVDIIDCPSMASYQRLNERAQFWRVNSRSAEFAARLDALAPVDLVFIDSHHHEEQCRRELDLIVPRASMVALHDIANVGCPGIGHVWRDATRWSDYERFEYVDQYGNLGPFMGIGLAVKKHRMRAAEVR